MESPVVLDKPPEYHGSSRDNERGFPFDEEEGSGAWSELAARHPDIAARLRQRPATWARKRRPSSQDATDDFGDNFGGFDRFPFEDIPLEFREHFPTHWNRRFVPRDEPQTHTQTQAQAPPPPPQPHSPQHHAGTQTEENPGPSGHTQYTLPQYGLRNTVDLGQKSPADPSLIEAGERNQRSMSAPPDSYAVNQSNLPKMNSQEHHEQAHHAEHPAQSNVRHIPIFVEGRDEPIINKSADHGSHYDTKPSSAPPPPQPQPHIDREQYFPDEPVFNPPPNFSRSFGTPFHKGFRQGPQPFVQQKVYPQTAFTRGASPQRSQSPKTQMHPEEHFVKVPVHHEHSAPKPEPPRPQPKPAPQPAPQQQQQQHHHQEQQQPPPARQSPPPPPRQQTPSNDPITQILSIQTDVLNLMTEVENFTGTKNDKQYLFLDEMLTRNLIKLDNIETDGKENIRLARKEAIRCIQKCIAVLEAKADQKLRGGITPQPQDVDMQSAEAVAEAPVTANGVEVQMKEPADSEALAEPQVEQQGTPETNAINEEPKQEEVACTSEVTEAAHTEQSPNTEGSETPEQSADKKESIDNKSPKKGTKNVKKRDKSKDKKESSNDSSKEQIAESQAVDDQGDKTNTQTMEVDGAASQ